VIKVIPDMRGAH